MSDQTENKSFPDQGQTQIMNTAALEEKLRLAREAALAETVKEDFPTVRDSSLADTGSFSYESIFREIREAAEKPEPEPEPQPVIPTAPVHIPPEEPLRSDTEEELRQKKKKRVRIMLICGIAVIALAVMLIVIISIKNKNAEQEYETAYSHARMYYYEGNYDKALEQLRTVMSLDKTDECLLLMADCYEAKGDYVNAVAILESSTSGSDLIKMRIQKLKSAAQEIEDDKLVKLGGREYPVDSSSLDLSKQKLKSSDLSELGRFEALTTLKLADNRISSLSFLRGMTTLQSLDLSKNSISDISELAGLTELYSLHLDDNDIEDFSPLYSLKKLTSLTINGMEIGEKSLDELKKALPGCTIYSEEATRETEEIEFGGKTFPTDATTLDLSGLGLTDISELAKFTELETLDLSGNNVHSITALLELPNIKYLDLSSNSVSDIRPLMNMAKLEYLNLENNSVSSVAALTELGSLTELILAGNSIKSFSSLASLNKLKALNLCATGITDAELQNLYGLSNLKELALNDNAELTKSAVGKLEEALPNCSITHSELKDLIELGGQKFDADSVNVSASGLGISDITAVSGFQFVKNLDLSNNKISDLTAIAFLTGLEVLDLENNRIKDIAPLLGLTRLKELYLSGNQISPEQVQALTDALPDCFIDVT